MQRTRKWIAGGAVVAALTLASLGTAFAADPAPGTPGPRGPVAGAVNAVCQGVGQGFAGVAQAIEKLTGVKPDKFLAERQAGKSPVQIAKENGSSEQALTDEVLASRKAALAEAVKAGRITQAQADYMLKNMTDRVDDALNSAAAGPRGRMGGAAIQDCPACGTAGTPGAGLGPGGMRSGSGPAWSGQDRPAGVQPGQGVNPRMGGRWSGQPNQSGQSFGPGMMGRWAGQVQ